MYRSLSWKKIRLPRYTYFCEDCESCFDVSHSLQNTFTLCKNCGSDGALVRKPSEVFLTTKHRKTDENLRVGSVVKEAIEDAKQELKSDQDSLKKRIYKK